MFTLVLRILVSALLVLSLNARSENQASSLLSVSAPSVQALLTKMSRDAARINYSGSFTYQNQTRAALQSFKVEHWVENGQEHDRLLFLNGPEREILREGRPIDCNSMGNKLLQGSFANFGKSLINLNNLYQFEIRGQERIAGRLARVLLVIPKDVYRYGYFLSIDEETGLVLKSWLIDENARPLERYQFVSIDFNSDANKGLRSVSPHHHKVIANATPCNPMSFSKPELWQVAWVPSGFEFAGQRTLGNGQEMLMYTDGLTTFSIFIESAAGVVPEGVGQSGATLAYMSSLVHKKTLYRVNVVGEIPVAAATKIAQNITLP
ncbi:MAG: MucB/RseB C-terminal domain-containing protein [Pseudomonadota bacterium]